MATSEEITFVLLLLNFMKEFEFMKSTKKGKDSRKRISDGLTFEVLHKLLCESVGIVESMLDMRSII